ncbi:DUF6255 family natural product biosynthesis protein [Streptomyces gamaensis]|uniref:DUF6255 family natural product biosynthesis protein n=1 Tax=Streptomyces gamaensis TaxID=1763542 RepID=A0ABW0YUV3_9ACTN
MTRRAVGRLVNQCAHPEGWQTHDGVTTCASGCGTERYMGYAALLTPQPPADTLTRRAAGISRALPADRRADFDQALQDASTPTERGRVLLLWGTMLHDADDTHLAEQARLAHEGKLRTHTEEEVRQMLARRRKTAE